MLKTCQILQIFKGWIIIVRVIASFTVIDIKKNLALSTEISFRAVEELNEIPKKIPKQTVYV